MGGITAGTLTLVVLSVLWLVFLEGLLSADNALVLAVMVRHLDKAEQKRALRYGIWGAFAFRLVAVLLAGLLLHFWYLKIFGGLYLFYLAATHFFLGEGDESDPARKGQGDFWWTVVRVEMADIAFSIDSILAAVAMADGLPRDQIGDPGRYAIVVIGGILGIITMRFVAGSFIKLLDRFKGLEPGAYGLVAWIGLKLITGGLFQARLIPDELNGWIFWPGMIVIVLVSLLYRAPRGPEASVEEQRVVEEVARIARGDDTGHAV